MPPPPDSKINLDTGDPGFEIDGEEYTYDIGDSQDPQVPGPGKQRKKTIDVDKSYNGNSGPKDLSKGTLLTLSQYMSNLTNGTKGTAKRPNSYPVDYNSAIEKLSLETKGYPTTLSPTTNSQKFIDSASAPGLNPYGKNYSSISATLKKGAASPNNINGNLLLQNLTPTPVSDNEPGFPIEGKVGSKDSVVPYVSAILKRNRFKNENVYNSGQMRVRGSSFNNTFELI